MLKLDELGSYDKFDGVGPHSETIETRARIGERYLDAYESALNDPRLAAGYMPADCPSELLLDLLNGVLAAAPTDQPRPLPDNRIVALANKYEGWSPDMVVGITVADLRVAAMAVGRAGPDEAVRAAATMKEAHNIVDEVIARFANWKPSPAMLGFARAVAVHALQATPPNPEDEAK